MGHKQVICITKNGSEIEVDEKIAPYIQKLWDNGVYTWTSCQWDGDKNKKYPAYINPCLPKPYHIPASPEEMARILGLERSQWRQYNGVIWLHRSLVS